MESVGMILQKQWKDTWKNEAVLIQFLMFPVLVVIMTKLVKIDGMPKNFFVNLFASMYVGMAPLTSLSAVIAEEKEKNTLRVLLMADVAPWQYLFGVGGYVFLACMIGSTVFCALLDGVSAGGRGIFFAVMAAGILASGMIGAVIGGGSRNQMGAASAGIPVMQVFSLLPMLSMFHDGVAKVAGFTYSEQVRILVAGLSDGGGRAGCARLGSDLWEYFGGGGIVWGDV